MSQEAPRKNGFLTGVTVLELADERGEYCGKVLAGLGADVIKIEPLGGEQTRTYGPFYRDQPHPDRSLYFWHYNLGKRGIVLDLDDAEGQQKFKQLVARADVLIDTRAPSYLRDRGLDYETLKKGNPGLVYGRITPFGDDGPWADFEGSDLVHLALGGMMMNCGYDADPSGHYDTPPIAPQMWHAYHIAGEIAAIEVMAALSYRHETGRGQRLSVSIHEAVSKNTETDMPDWVYYRQPHFRQTCRHSFPQTGPTRDLAPTAGASFVPISRTSDGRWMLAHRAFFPGFLTPLDFIVKVLKHHGFQQDLEHEKYQDLAYLQRPEVTLHIGDVIDRLSARLPYASDLWKQGQDAGLPWAPLRRPEENLTDPHWQKRETFADVHYPELGQTFTQINAKWVSPQVPWSTGTRAPLLGEHTKSILATLSQEAPRRPAKPRTPPREPVLSKHGKPFALSGVRIVDLSWLLASGGAGRFFTALGAEVIKVEHVSRPDGMRFAGSVGPGGRAARDSAAAPLAPHPNPGLNRAGSFMEINAGKRSLSLNLKLPRARELLRDLLKDADMVIEGFSPGTMDRMGFGYEKLREINPRIVYVQQSGMGQIGVYGQLRSFGPSAQAFSGLSEMSGLPTPYPPAGIGYSYLDWFGAYQMATAMMAALYRQRQTGQGCWIDSSQVETGLYLTGTAILDYTVNGRPWSRLGNRSPYKPAAPHGAYRCKGDDRWLAIAAFTEEQWWSLVKVLDKSEWAADSRFANLSLRMSHQDALDTLLNDVCKSWEPYALMEALQKAKVPAGVCQTTGDRCERDPQLRHLQWMVELNQTEIGRWPVKEIPVKFSETPVYLGGTLDRHGPNYGEDNEYVLRNILGLSDADVNALAAQGVL